MKNKLYDAIYKSVSGKISVYIVQFLFLAIYARIFTPEEFGILASVQVFVIFFQMIAEIGIGPAIINEEKFNSKQRDGVFTVTLILGVCLGICFYFSYHLINIYYQGYNYKNIITLISLSLFFTSLTILPVTALNKDAKFITIAKVNIISEIISFLCVYVLYFYGFGVLALASKIVVQSISRFLLSWLASLNTELGRPMFGRELFHIRIIASFASYQFYFNFVNYFSRNLDNILIGKYIGMLPLGIYDKAYQLMRYPLMLTTSAMTPAIQPILTKNRSNISIIVMEHNKLTKKLLLLSVLISTFLYMNSNNIVLLLFGSQWVAVIPLIKIFSFMIPVQAVLSTSGSFFQVMNKPKLLFFSGLLSSVVNITCIILGVYLGSLEDVALLLLIAFSINFIQCYFILFKYCFNVEIYSFLKGLLKAIFFSIIPIIIYVITRILYNIIFPCDVFFVDLIINLLLASFSIILIYILNKRYFKFN